jgi:DnaJ-class molecular chaperone
MNYEDIDKARKILNLDEASTMKEIKASYRRLANIYHPDKNNLAAKNNDEMIKKLNQAYKILLDYCADYRYSFKEDAVARTYPYEEKMRKWNDNWFDSI